ncbi:unnamed protein product [Didymodactylos carnosus]|uniref:Reverse transcriptase domain-containing protein n=1 Tax=Didymodactylos carnosus TaxID=1234261 RepID=A0A814MTC1_9BILA|nr:unnamed protein product [Didymodactylos carnosus]CAF3849321.1 unnamed protein product [Didymodactylos carnosus]
MDASSSTQVLTGPAQQRRKSHGNQGLRRYRRRCCIRGMNEAETVQISSFRKQLLRRRQRSSASKKNTVDVCPQVILDVGHVPLNAAQLKYLSRGPGYIRPNQSSLRPYHRQMNRVKKEETELMNKILKFFSENHYMPRSLPIFKQYAAQLHDCLVLRYTASLSFTDQIQARREFNLTKLIRRKFKRNKLILRETDRSGVFHVGRASDYEKKAAMYRIKTGAYEELHSNPFDEIFTKVEGTPLRPISNTKRAATTGISKYLDQIIRPLFDKYAKSTTIVDGVDLLDKLQRYIAAGYLTASTLFVTFDIIDLYTMLPQEEALAILAEFLHEHGCEKVEKISIETIKYYRQVIGGAMGSPFILTLANIFMWKWEKQTILSKISNVEVYGRYIDDSFYTSNETAEKVQEILETANRLHPNIKLTWKISKAVSFLDLCISNNDGHLSSSVYHKPRSEPSLVPFLSDHPRHVFRNIVHTALMRAIRYSSSFELFDDEQRSIRLLLLYNG